MSENPYASPQIEQEPGLHFTSNGFAYRPLNELFNRNLVCASVVTGASAILTIIAWIVSASRSVSPVAEPPLMDEINWVEVLQGLLGVILFLTSIAWNICFLMATYRLGANTHALIDPPPTYSPSYAAGAYFIPFVNIIRPYQVMRDFYDACNANKSWLLIGWWATHLISGMIGYAAFRVDMSVINETVPVRRQMMSDFAMLLDTAGLPFEVGLAITSHLVLSQLASRQSILASQKQPQTD